MKYVSYVVLVSFVLLISVLSCNHVKEKSDKEYANSSGIVLAQYDDQTIENLSLLCKVWGFAKYYHPDILRGKCNWDFELFRVMPAILEANSKEKRNKVLYKWIKKLPQVERSEEFITMSPDSIKMYPDIAWIEDEKELGKKLSEELVRIKYSKRDFLSYAHLCIEYGARAFRNEEPYSHLSMPDMGFRLLSLFRYWNIIQYYFPYKYLIGEDWNKLIPEFIPQMIEAKTPLAYLLVLKKLSCRTNDSHASFSGHTALDNLLKFEIPSVIIQFVEGKAMIVYVGNEKKVSLKKGDIILAIDNVPVDSIIKQQLPYIPASNYTIKLRNGTESLLRSQKEKLLIKYDRNEKVFTDSVKLSWIVRNFRLPYPYASKPPFEILPGNIGYLNLGSYTKSTVPKSLNTKGLIIDLRLAPSGMVEDYQSYDLLYSEAVDYAAITDGSPVYPGLFAFKKVSRIGKVNPEYYKGKKVILVNEDTQSHAEFMAMRYRCAPNAIIIGSTTAAADGNVALIKLPGGLKTVITSLGVYYPDRTETQRVGIALDIEVKPTVKGIREGRDEVLERAIQLIQEDK